MPVSRRLAQNADLRAEAADKMQIDVKYVFFLPKSRSRPVLAIWTEGWTEEEIQRVRAMKSEIKAMAAAVGAKIYMTPIHPSAQEERERQRRKSRGPKYRQRRGVKTMLGQPKKSGASKRRKTPEELAAATPEKRLYWSKVSQFNGGMRKRRYTALVKAKGEKCAECGDTPQRKASGHLPLTVDHIQSLSNGGDNDLSNMQLLCKPCHVMKSRFEGDGNL
jgi:5-methylcytosine-specific restriction endonuclease McrA